jgi:S-(hydroxymethyl)glutathione dehydrogenase / alcohol dehydrogenase
MPRIRRRSHGFGFPVPGVLGHEVAGVVTEIGPDVTQCAVGDHVVGSLIQYCGACAACLDGRTYQCAHPEVTLRSADQPGQLTRYGATVHQIYGLGAFAEQVLAHENQLTPIPAEVPFAQAAVLGCATITGAGAALNTARVRPGDTVAVVGVGGIGLNVISGAVLAGAERIIAIDVGAPKLVLARRFGATDTINSTEVEPNAALRKIVPLGVDHAFEAVGLKQTSELVANRMQDDFRRGVVLRDKRILAHAQAGSCGHSDDPPTNLDSRDRCGREPATRTNMGTATVSSPAGNLTSPTGNRR